MRLWRLTREAHLALDGVGGAIAGGRYVSPGRPVVHLASEAGLAVLIAMRYLDGDPRADNQPFFLGWTEVSALPERVPANLSDDARRAFSDAWLAEQRSLLLAIPSAVLPEGDVLLMNPAHPDAAMVAPLTIRPFSFAECLHRPPMLDSYRAAVRSKR